MTKLTENERKALNNACARLRETNLGTKIGNIEDFLDIDILKTDANTVSKAIDELFDKWANPLLNITVPPPGFFTLAGDAEGNLWCYCNDETNPPIFEHDETTGDLYLNIASEDGANSYQVHVGNYIAVKHLNDYYKKTEIDSKLGGKSNVGHNHDERYYTETEIDAKVNNINSQINSLIGFTATIVNSLPSTGEVGVMYLKLNTSASVEGNIYDEYIWVNNKFEKIGSTETTVDLSGYVTQTEMNTQLANKSNINHNHNSTYSLLNHQHAGLNDKVDIICRSGGQQTTTGYRKVFRLKITNQYFDSPVSFEFVQRKSRQTARVHIIFNSVTSTDPSLRAFTYDGAIEMPIYLYKESASTWVFIFKEQSNYDTVNIRFLPLSSSIKDSCTITPINEFLSDLPTDNVQVGSMISATSTRTGYMDRRDKIKLDGIDDGANKTVVDSSLSSSSTNPVQNKIVTDALNGKADSNHTHSIENVTNLQSKLDTIPSLTSTSITVSGTDNQGTITFYKFGKIVIMELNLSKVHLSHTWNVVGIVPNGYIPKLSDAAGAPVVFWNVQGQQGQSAQLNIKGTGEIRFAYGNGDKPPLHTYVTYIVN